MPAQVKYPWNKWFRRKRITLNKGIDYDCMSHGMAQQFRKEAAKRDCSISIVVNVDSIEVALDA